MNVLVTGGAGFIGSHTVDALRARGDTVRVLDALTQPVHQPGVNPPVDGPFLRGDVRDKETWELALDGMDAVVHLAAYQDYMPDYSTFMHVNATGTALLYEVIRERSLPIRRVVYASSQSVYGEGQVRCDEHGVVAAAQRRADDMARGDFETRCAVCGKTAAEPVAMAEDFQAPHNAYGIAKLAGEQAALILGEQNGIETVALRYAIVHGPGQSPRNAYSGLLRSAALALLSGRAPVVFEDGKQLRDYVAIDDVVAANMIALDHADAPGRAYNVGGARTWSVLELLEQLNTIVPHPREPEAPGLFRLGDVRHTIGDLSRLRGLGWEPETDMLETWRAYWDWLADQDIGADVVGDAYEDMQRKGILRSAKV